MPEEETGGAKEKEEEEEVEDPKAADREILKDYSVIKVCGGEDTARETLALLNSALEDGRFSIAGKGLSDEPYMRVIKAVSILSKMKNLLPRRTSVLPITEVDFSGNCLLQLTPHPFTAQPELSAKSLQPLQLTVQFVRVSTDAKIVRMNDCNLQGSLHNKDDKVEQEVIRLVKKFGTGRDPRYAREVCLAGNKFEAEFAKKIVEAAYWERARDPDKEHPPKLLLDLRRNRIRLPLQIIDELRAGKNAGGAISVALSEEPEEARREALIVVNMTDQIDRDPSPMRVAATSGIGRPPAEVPGGGGGRRRSRSRSRSGGRRRSRSPSKGRRRR